MMDIEPSEVLNRTEHKLPYPVVWLCLAFGGTPDLSKVIYFLLKTLFSRYLLNVQVWTFDISLSS